MNGFMVSSTDILVVCSPQQHKEVVRIDREGRIFCNGREVESDTDFRGAMLELAAYFRGTMK